MDTPTQVLTGVLVGETFFRPKLGRAGPVVCGIAALVPDLDFAARLVTDDPFFLLRHHRGLSHSLLLAPVLAEWGNLLFE